MSNDPKNPKGKMTGHYKAAKSDRRSYVNRAKATLTDLNLRTDKPEDNDDESDQDNLLRRILRIHMKRN